MPVKFNFELVELRIKCVQINRARHAAQLVTFESTLILSKTQKFVNFLHYFQKVKKNTDASRTQNNM